MTKIECGPAHRLVQCVYVPVHLPKVPVVLEILCADCHQSPLGILMEGTYAPTSKNDDPEGGSHPPETPSGP